MRSQAPLKGHMSSLTWLQPIRREALPAEYTVLDDESCHASLLTTAGAVLMQIGLRLLQNDGNVFACHHNIAETIKHSEFGASSVILSAGESQLDKPPMHARSGITSSI